MANSQAADHGWGIKNFFKGGGNQRKGGGDYLKRSGDKCPLRTMLNDFEYININQRLNHSELHLPC